MIQQPRLTVVQPTRPAVRELRQPSRTEGSVWRRGYACGKEDGIFLSYVAVIGYGSLTGVVGFMFGWWLR